MPYLPPDANALYELLLSNNAVLQSVSKLLYHSLETISTITQKNKYNYRKQNKSSRLFFMFRIFFYMPASLIHADKLSAFD